MKLVDRYVMRAVPWMIPFLTIGILVIDLLAPVGIAVSILYVIPILLTLFSPRVRDPLYFSAAATVLTWIDLLVKPVGVPIPYAVSNRALGTTLIWGIAIGLIQYKRTQQELKSARVEQAQAEGLMMAAQEARYYADRDAVRAAVGRSEAEEQLLISRLRLESIIESAMDAIITVDEEQRAVLFNRAAEQMFGCSTREAIGQPLDRFLPARFREAHHHHVQGFGESSLTSRKMGKLGTVMGLRSNGEEFPIEAAISHIVVERKKFYTVILRDITERKQAEETIREGERQLATLIGNLPGFVYRCNNDRDRTFEYVSEGVSDLTGYTVDEYLAQRSISYGEKMRPDDREHVWQEVQTALEQHRPFEMTYRVLTKSGEVKWVWERGEGIYRLDGSLNYLEGFVTDVTERKRAEQLLRQSEESYRRLIAFSPYAILVNRGDRIVFANDQAIKLFGGVKADEILGTPLLDLIHPDCHAVVRQRIHELLEGRQVVPVTEEQIVRLDGRSLDVEMSATRFTDEEGPAILAMLRDVSEWKRLQEQLRKTERIAELGTLASGMAHEIGTPMNVILGRAEYLMDRVTEEPIKKGLQTIVTQVERITKVMNQLLSFARRKAPERRPLNIRTVIEDGMEMFEERLAQSLIKVELILADHCPLVLADPDQMSQIFINLVMNAVHAMPDGGTLRVALMAEKQMVKLTVADTGCGIPRAMVTKIFEPFFTTKEFGKGTGLGLTVVKGIIEEHQGSIAVESEEGKGTTFKVLLPLASTS
ncbi:MAG: PAS domain S-box protein [Nitrospira sp.]|nr:PAS domain S-box protein [Nitrospira sp.]MDH4368453.1 PAS domain S-box protein [Nitrospira sp.]MDH5724012.1 PAS domain S-box protein [Nitrospira sp.]